MSNINVVIDMSNGLNEGITQTSDAAMETNFEQNT